ncbi:hypothetical protein A2442_01700 [Candidatus Campbellbacteria bacterium RIFOXYC2_FULL_35_25]|uniref:Uncharacterized protein n=1 Tax=Candidatus Campbellbacteria bacterium RIFOXYC2_FULL_35_25 TaxID=1797582 RepID=A0A1F5EHB7_9BACT|nr:MAG: hypothetical protein A2442_01700 [Candidatus Campbellbacteria bacterium RIFOXYC2_FULL_35_25]
MKKITIGVIILVIISAGFILWNKPDSQGMILLENDDYHSFFPKKFDISQDVRIMDLATASTEGGIYINYSTVGSIIKVGEQDNTSDVSILESRRGIYRVPDKDPSFKMWVEKTSQDNFSIYKEKSLEEISSYYDSLVIKKNYENHDYYVYLRKDLSNENLKDKSSIGGAYLFFPEKNIVVYLYFFNTKFQGCLEGKEETCKFNENEKILDESDFVKIIETIINAN